jgi:hypothetical protein
MPVVSLVVIAVAAAAAVVVVVASATFDSIHESSVSQTDIAKIDNIRTTTAIEVDKFTYLGL